MKKNIILGMGILLLFSQFLFSQSYYINKDTHNYNPRGFQPDVDLPKGSIIYLDKDSEVSSYRPDEDTNIIKISGLYQEQKLTFYSSDVNILNNDTFDSELLEKKWIPSYYFSILKSKQIQQSLLDYEPFWKKWVAIDSWETNWIDAYNITNIILSNTNLFIPMIGHLESSYVIFSTLKRTDTGYIAKIKSVDSYTNHPEFVSLLNANDNSLLSFIIDGDYMTMKLDDKEIIKLCACDDSMYFFIKNCIKNNTYDLSRVTWPRHADGSCDYDGSKKTTAVQTAKATPSTNVAQKKTMTVKENLKLRSGEATSTQVLTVMQAGAKVKILELGKSETIDGISSNWVKVEVQKGAKDRDGNPIKAGTVGWCYGGYLE
ncbi:MAG: SH3 domain-containing protein [Spirochaetia bacterium]|nr:SH3 domain-containing protein [Spirochaetia bacterium]